MNTLQGRSLCAFQNLLTILPHDALGGKDYLVGVWHSLLALMQIGSQFLHPNALLDAMGALIENGSAHGSLGIIAEDLHYLCQLGLTSPDPRMRSGIMHLLGTVDDWCNSEGLRVARPATVGCSSRAGLYL